MEKYEDGVCFRHIRNYKFDARTGEDVIDNMGGATIAFKEVSPNRFRVAQAVCSDKDNFCRKKGRVLAGNRLKSDKHAFEVDVTYEEFKKMLFYPYDGEKDLQTEK